VAGDAESPAVPASGVIDPAALPVEYLKFRLALGTAKNYAGNIAGQ